MIEATVRVDSLSCFLLGNLDLCGRMYTWAGGVVARNRKHEQGFSQRKQITYTFHFRGTPRMGFVLAFFSEFTRYYYAS